MPLFAGAGLAIANVPALAVATAPSLAGVGAADLAGVGAGRDSGVALPASGLSAMGEKAAGHRHVLSATALMGCSLTGLSCKILGTRCQVLLGMRAGIEAACHHMLGIV